MKTYTAEYACLLYLLTNDKIKAYSVHNINLLTEPHASTTKKKAELFFNKPETIFMLDRLKQDFYGHIVRSYDIMADEGIERGGQDGSGEDESTAIVSVDKKTLASIIEKKLSNRMIGNKEIKELAPLYMKLKGYDKDTTINTNNVTLFRLPTAES